MDLNRLLTEIFLSCLLSRAEVFRTPEQLVRLLAVFLESFADGRLADAELLSNFSLGQALLAKGLNLSHYSG